MTELNRDLARLLDSHEQALADLEAHHGADLAAVWKTVGDDLERYTARLWLRIVGDRDVEATPEQLAELRRRLVYRLRRLVAAATVRQQDVMARAVADAEVMGRLFARRELGALNVDDDGDEAGG
jgi:hypothetical protein